MMTETAKVFIKLLRIALGKEKNLCCNPSPEEWQKLFFLSQEQAVVGFLLPAIDTLYHNGKILPKALLIEWIGQSEQIKQRNMLLNARIVELKEHFAQAGFNSCILKGQGNAQMYPLPESRSPGDIDILLDGEREVVWQFVQKHYPKAKECYWHIDYPLFDDVSVEVHFIPSYARSPKYDKRLQQYFYDNAVEQFSHNILLNGTSNKISVPTPEYNLIQQLSHVMRHFFIEGVGMRHILDLYYLLHRGESELDKDWLAVLLPYLGMKRFAGAVMWVLHDILGLEDKYLITFPDEHRGKLLLNEILQGGNWGRYDKRVIKKLGRINGFLPSVMRSVRLMIWFPYEAVITPIERRIERLH